MFTLLSVYFTIKIYKEQKLLFHFCKFSCRLTLKKYMSLNLNLGRTEIIMRRRSLTGTVSTACCLNDLRSASLTSLLSGFRKRFMVDFSSNAIRILIVFFQTFFIVEFTKPDSWYSQLTFSIFYFSYQSLILPTDAQ